MRNIESVGEISFMDVTVPTTGVIHSAIGKCTSDRHQQVAANPRVLLAKGIGAECN